MKETSTLLAFNRGIVDTSALSRLDLKRLALSAEVMTNWIAGLLGKMSIRPGTTYLHQTPDTVGVRHLPFVFSTDDTAIVELSDGAMRVVINDELLARVAVTTTISEDYGTDWTDSSEAGASVSFTFVGLDFYARLNGDGTSEARVHEQLAVAAGDQNKEHALRIEVRYGVVTLRIGTTLHGAEYVEHVLRPGWHSIAFTPTEATLYVEFASRSATYAQVGAISFESVGVVELTAPWVLADLANIRTDQSGDVIFAACAGEPPQRIERQAARSWSVVEYQADGPYRDANTSGITITPSALSGGVTLTASKPVFNGEHVGAVFRLEHQGQNVVDNLTALNDTIEPIRVTGVLDARLIAISVTFTGAGSATVALQRSVGDIGAWTDVETYTATTTKTYNDGLDNQIVYYRLTAIAYVAPMTVDAELAYDAGTSRGRARITSITSTTVASANVEDAFGALTATDTWWEGAWSDYRGWPTAVRFDDGRLWFGSATRIDGSVSDDFTNFDDAVEGDSGPIRRNLASGPVDTINWIASTERLLIGTEGAEHVAKASSLDEPLTPSAFSLRKASTIGSAAVDVLQIDTSAFFVGRSGSRLYEIAPSADGYQSADLSVLVPKLFTSPIVRTALQRFPDTRIHCVRADGKVGILLFDKLEKANCWMLYETSGEVRDVVILPGPNEIEDRVYYAVDRGAAGLCLERWNTEAECLNGVVSKLADSGVLYSGASTTSITGLGHLEGQSVCVWSAGVDLGTFTVASGAITLPSAVTSAFVGLPYTADWKSARLAIASATGNPLTQKKVLDHLGLVLENTHAQGLQYGDSFDYLDDMPQMEQGAPVVEGAVHAIYDETSFELNGAWTTDTRLCLRAQAPRAATVLAAVVSGAGHDKR